MAILHPDKLVGITRAIQSRPALNQPSVEERAIQAAAAPQSTLTPQGKASQDNLLQNLAFEIHAQRNARHLGRMARDEAAAKQQYAGAPAAAAPTKPAEDSKPITITIGGK